MLLISRLGLVYLDTWGGKKDDLFQILAGFFSVSRQLLCEMMHVALKVPLSRTTPVSARVIKHR